jgi:hypothetical protein
MPERNEKGKGDEKATHEQSTELEVIVHLLIVVNVVFVVRPCLRRWIARLLKRQTSRS